MQTIYLDISNKGVYPCVESKEGEVGRKFLAVITDNNIPYSFPSDSVLSVWYEGASGSGNDSSIGEVSAFKIDGNNVAVELVNQMLLVPGDGDLCLTITHGDGREISSWNIPYCVEKKPGAGSSVPEQYYTALTEAGAVAAKAIKEAESIANNAKESITLAQEAADKADKASAIIDSAADNAEQAVQKAENIVAINNTKQNKLSWVTEEDILAMIDGTYSSEEDENPEPGYAPRDYQITDTATGSQYSLYVDNGDLKMEAVV